MPLSWPVSGVDARRKLDALRPLVDLADVRVIATDAVFEAAFPVPAVTTPDTRAHGRDVLPDPGATAFLQFTSGSLGRPRGAALAAAEAAERLAEATRTRATASRELVELTIHGVPLDNRLSRSALGVSYRPFAATLADFDRWATRLGFLPQPPEARP